MLRWFLCIQNLWVSKFLLHRPFYLLLLVMCFARKPNTVYVNNQKIHVCLNKSEAAIWNTVWIVCKNTIPLKTSHQIPHLWLGRVGQRHCSVLPLSSWFNHVLPRSPGRGCGYCSPFKPPAHSCAPHFLIPCSPLIKIRDFTVDLPKDPGQQKEKKHEEQHAPG